MMMGTRKNVIVPTVTTTTKDIYGNSRIITLEQLKFTSGFYIGSWHEHKGLVDCIMHASYLFLLKRIARKIAIIIPIVNNVNYA